MKNNIFFPLTIIFLINKSISQNCGDNIKIMPLNAFSVCNNNTWKLVFEDNFEDNNLNTDLWELQKWSQGGLYGNKGVNQEYNSLNNVNISDGTLKIIAKKETIQRKAIDWKPEEEILQDGLPNLRTYNYTSSNIWTKNKFSYGKFEARVKIPKGKGFWPAFWTYADNPWSEIDIFEFWNEDYINGNYDDSKLSKVHNMNVHYDYDKNGKSNYCSSKYTATDFSEDFHIFTLIWDQDKIQWYVDGDLKRTDYQYYNFSGQAVCTVDAFKQYAKNQLFPTQPMHIILNLAIQSSGNDDSPDHKTPFPSQMEIDWVRYYKRENCNDINITNSNQFNIKTNIFNSIVGKSITLNCNYDLIEKQQLDLIAQNLIKINPGFNVKERSNFHAKINPELCTINKNSNYEEIDTSYFFQEKDKLLISNKNHEINIYPNPNNGNFIIDFGNNDSNNFDISITDLAGKNIFNLNQVSKQILSLSLNEISSGIYIIHIYDTNNNKINYFKIIIQ
jgi:beta-glucanase (GH16 family)